MLTFVCIICRLVQPRSAGRPVSDDKYPSWRCADADACAARFLPKVCWCGSATCPGINGLDYCPVWQEGEARSARGEFLPIDPVKWEQP